MIIREVFARIIKDSREEDTIEVVINNCIASSPSGKSTGKYETPSYKNSLNWNINSINNLKELMGIEINSFHDIKKIETLIKRKFKLKDAKDFGANALFALECATLKALAKSKDKELWQVINDKARSLPTPVGNAIGGGLHSHSGMHPVFQEFLLIPKGTSFEEKYTSLKSVYLALDLILETKNINDEGAWECSLSEEEILKHLKKFSDLADIGVDIAASSFYIKNLYKYKTKHRSRKEQINYIEELISRFNLQYIEDPLEEEDFSGFSHILKNIGKQKSLIVGDDLTATHLTRLRKALKNKSINAMIIKPNQNGSLLELKEIFEFCKKHKITTVISHRSGETLDNALADLAFGFQADYIKCGIATQWREAKLARLLDIEYSLNQI